MQSAPSPPLGQRPQTLHASPRRRSPPAKRQRTSPPPHVSQCPPSSASSSPSESFPPNPPDTDTPTADAAQHSPTPPPVPAAAKWFRKPSVVWYRGHDMRVEDHPALLAAAQRGGPVVPFFVWDPSDGFGESLGSVKKWWLRESLLHLQRDLRRLGVHLHTRTGRSTEELRAFLKETGADAVFWNRCYEPDLLGRDEKLRDELVQNGLTAESFKAELLVEPWELSSTEVSPCYDTFHAYMRAWMTLPPPPQPLPCPSRLPPIRTSVKTTEIDKLGLDVPSVVQERMSKLWVAGSRQAKLQLDKFLHDVFPAFGEDRCRRHIGGTSKLSPHIRFGELSPRRMYHATRLRVARWDQRSLRAASHPAFFDGGKKSRLPPKPVSSTADKELKALPGRPLENGAAGNGKLDRADASQIAKKKGGEYVHQHQKGAEDAVKEHETKQQSMEVKRKQSSLVRRGGLPHISSSARAFLKNLCLRDFSYHVLFHNSEMNVKPLVPQFTSFPWAEDNGSFSAWLEGKTGYPIVDAAMRELNETGWIHNGLRFLLACFLTKYLLLPWSRGLREFYTLLVDGDHSSNALGWQWTAGSNTDAFPMSCLVNPVKVAYQHDPSGSYVRRWIPELAGLPIEYLHQPWKAPLDVLKSAGVELGDNYSKRIIKAADARSRALDAMIVMKRICATSRVMENIFDGDEKDLVKEWPSEESDVLNIDDNAMLSGKMSLLSSLWNLPHSEQPSTCLAGSALGPDLLIALNTASVVDGALGLPSEDRHESIEHALVAAGAQEPALTSFLGDCAITSYEPHELDTPASPKERNSDTEESNPAEDANKSGDEPLVESANCTPPERNSVSAPKSFHEASQVQDPVVTRTQADASADGHYSHRQLDGISMQRSVNVPQAPVPHMSLSGSHTPYIPQPQQQFQQFHQLQQLQHFHQLQQFHLQQQQHQPPHQPANGQPPPQARQLPHTSQQLRSNMHQMMEGVYAGNPNDPHPPGVSGAGMTMGNSHVMVGPATSAAEVPVHSMFPGGDANNPAYDPHFGMGQYYGFPQVMPLMTPHGLNGSDRGEGSGPVSTANGPKHVGIPNMLPMGYGLYGANMLDPNVLGNAFPPNGLAYGSMVGNSQQQSHVSAQQPYSMPHQGNYFPPPVSSDMTHAQRHAHLPPTHVAEDGRPGGAYDQSSAERHINVAAAAAAAVAAGGREVAVNVEGQNHSRTNAPQNVDKTADGMDGSSRHLDGFVDGGKRGSSASVVDAQKSALKSNQTRAITKASPKPKGGARSKRTSTAAATGRRPDSKSQTNARTKGEGGGPSSQRKKIPEAANQPATTLESRKQILASVLEKKEHEYHGFAKYLSLTYELTANTDRHTSKDYIRLCNLKDDYHKQCHSDKDKLKIYRIKTFFSQILKLEVTGEWDRHNHGGVRGPYVYGIRLRTVPEVSEEGTKNAS